MVQSIEMMVTVGFIRKLVKRWTSDYHCCVQIQSKSTVGVHDEDCPLKQATAFLAGYDKMLAKGDQ